MLNSYFTVAKRNLLKNKFQSFLNIMCLAIGMASLLIILYNIKFEFSYDKFNRNDDRVFRVEYDCTYKNDMSFFGSTYHPGPLGPALKANLPEISDYTRIYCSENPIVFNYEGEKSFVKKGDAHWVDAGFLTMFDCLMLKGDKNNALAEPNTLVLTESLAKKYFGKDDPIGKPIMVDREIYRVTGICADAPGNTHFHYKYLLSYSSLSKVDKSWAELSWNGGNFYVYVILNSGCNVPDLEKKMMKIYQTYQVEDWATYVNKFEYKLRPITDIYFNNFSFQLEPGGDIKTSRFLIIVAIFVLLISLINSINLSTSKSIERAKEVGVRKVFGGQKSQLIYQFLAESLLINMIAIFIALIVFLISPVFIKNIFSTYSFSPVELLKEGWIWLLLITLLIVSVVMSGLYPAFILSSYKPLTGLQGKFAASTRGVILRKCLIIFQFVIAIGLIAGIITVNKQLAYMQSRDLAFNANQILIVNGPRISPPSALSSFKMEMLKFSKINSMSFSTDIVGQFPVQLKAIKRAEDPSTDYANAPGIGILSSDSSFLDVNGMKLLAGRNFNGSDRDAVIITEVISRGLNFVRPDEAIDKLVKVIDRERPLKIIGVIDDFHIPRLPKGLATVGILLDNDVNNYLSIKLNVVDVKNTISSVKDLWEKTFPKDPFDYFFLDDFFNRQYFADVQFYNFITFFTVIIIVIVCGGLWALSAHTVSSRTKEIGIRKVLNAGISDIASLLFNYFYYLIIIAAVISLPLAYYYFHKWLHNYSIQIKIGAWFFIIPVITILIVTLLTVGYNIFRATKNNPANSLKIE
jgi:putative ABC transport system permease protein